MKKSLNLFSLIICLSFLSSTIVNAQSAIENKTACEYLVTVEYGDDDCIVVDEVEVVVQPFSTLILPFSNSYQPITAKGAYNTTSFRNCPFFIGQPSCGNPSSESVSCTLLCGDYDVSISGNAIVIN